MEGADRSSLEIKLLLKNLDPSSTSLKHKDRLRRLQIFRNYVSSNNTPEFYDDDYSLLLLGCESPVLNEEELDELPVGLLRAVGAPSSDHKDALKRSARSAISLLRYLCCQFDNADNNNNGSVINDMNAIAGTLNGFASTFCSLNIPQLRMARFEVHIGNSNNNKGLSSSVVIDNNGSRGGSKEDACRLLTLLLARHTDTDMETRKPINIEELLPNATTRQEYERWLSVNGSSEVKRLIAENNNSSLLNGSNGDNVGGVSSFLKSVSRTRIDDNDDFEEDADDVLGAFEKSTKKNSSAQKKGVSTSSSRSGSNNNPMSTTPVVFDQNGKPTRWCDTQMASETQDRLGGAIFIEEEVSSLILFFSIVY